MIEGRENAIPDEQPPVLMTDETEVQQDVEAEYFEKDRPGKKQTEKHMNRNCEKIKLQNLEKLLDAQANDCVCSKAALVIAYSKSVFTIDPKEN